MAKQRQQTTTTASPAVSSEDSALTRVPGSTESISPPESALAAPSVNPAAAAFLERAGGTRQPLVSIPIIKIDHGAGQFELPTGEMVDEVSGYPILLYQTRRYYERAFSPSAPAGPPDCWSADMLAPSKLALKQQAPTCDGCPKNVFGTARDGRGKACGTYTWVFLLNSTFGRPPIAVLIAPPSSIKVLLGNTFSPGYFQRLSQRYECYEICLTVFGLERPAEGSPHCLVKPRFGGIQTDLNKVQMLADIRQQAMQAMENMRGMTPDVSPPEEE